ncbi:MAG: 5-(carboxyamino)imidazole ribonucleotide synthase [Alphaproteobacteria bacterium]|nr:5-(carboxyamino)imidazole ribonucleotide synthase [Alphaproteobacteria bacterium]
MIPTGSTIGILGGGQLGRMIAQAAQRLGYNVHVYANAADEPACLVTPFRTLGEFDDEAQLKIFADSVDVITLEWENVPVKTLEFLAELKPVHPGAAALKITQDRIAEKTFAKTHGIATPAFLQAKSLDELRNGVMKIGIPCVVKTCRMGYDGKGQAIIRDLKDIDAAWHSLKSDDAIIEGFVPFEKEISVIVARRADGMMQAYPPVENRHCNGILDETHVPAQLHTTIDAAAITAAKTLAEKLDIVGLLAVEFFVVQSNVIMNEMAPRPHNSGHWTMDFCATSQFEQLVRAICGLPLGSTAITAPCMMKNLIGDAAYDWQAYLNEPHAHLHLYGKSEARPGRKMGHVNKKS